jgi:hypothetical protein
MPRTEEIFGIRNEPVLSYVTRDGVDGRFKAAIASDHHMVVYGSSKQGKTSLRQKHLPDKQCVIVRCSPRMTTEGIYSSVLRQEGIRIQTMETSGHEVSGKVTAKVGFKAMIPWIGGAKTEVATEGAGKQQGELTQEFVSFDFSEAQSIGELLQAVSFKKFIVLENFHYLTQETQQQLAFDLKTFHEIKIRFVILGIWWEANHLMTYNGDLQDRLLEVPVEPWSEGDFDCVAAEGASILNIRLEKDVVDRFVQNSYGNIGMMQEFLKAFCLLSGVQETQAEQVVLGDKSVAERTLGNKVEAQRGQLLKTLQGIAANSRIRSNEGDPLLLPYYLALVICRTPVGQLQDGIEKNRLLQLLREVHHRGDKETIRIGDVTNLLTRLPTIQKGIQPPFLYYDSNNRRLRIVDTRYFFVLANANCADLAEEIPFPRDAEQE